MEDRQDLLFELGCEELPPKSLKKLSQSLLENILAGLQEAGLDHALAKAYASPRRLTVNIEAITAFQPDKTVEKRGPAVQAAFDAEGAPSKALLGFAASCGTSVEQLERLSTDKGEWLICRQTLKGQATANLLPDIIRKSLHNLPIAKRMRWGSGNTEFARPVHWVVLLFGRDIVPAEILGLHSGRISHGHRFHAPQGISIATPAGYEQCLYAQGKVITDFNQRMSIIRDAANQAAASVGGIAHIEDDLLEEIAALNEWPVPVIGSFDPRFLDLPMEVLITTMQSNQKYFPVKRDSGQLLPYFITFSNIESSNPEAIRHGNERVVLPRLADAEFFWNQDRKQPLAERVENLASIVFQKDLGTLADKTERVSRLASHIAAQLGADVALAQRAALLAKTDLLTNMVGEFANLQGTMGRYYALADGEPAEVAQALEEYYFPKQSGGPTPSGVTGQILAMAEKMDTLAGIFSVGQIPSGDRDPYALRRATLGLLRILIEHGIALDLACLLDLALAQFTHDFNRPETRQRLLDFIFDRLKGYCLEHGYSADEYEAVLAIHPTAPLDFMLRMHAVRTFRQLPAADSLSAANKRINNILKKTAQSLPTEIGPLLEPAEKNLLAAAKAASTDISPLLDRQNYAQALSRLAHLKDSVDAFFDDVMVNTEDPALRNSRLALLSMLSNLFMKIADISRLQA